MPVANRTAEPDDIFASVLVEDAEVKPESYEPSDTYRLLTRDGACARSARADAAGLMRLNEELHSALLQGLRVAREIEREVMAESTSAGWPGNAVCR